MLNPWIATIAVTDEKLPPQETLLQEMRNVPGYGRPEFLCLDDLACMEDWYVFRTPNATLFVMLQPTDESFLSQDDLISACRRAWHWPAAGQEISRMRLQVAVAVQPTDDTLDALDVALLTTHLASAVMKHTDAVGIYWHASGKIMQPADFIRKSEGTNRRTLPVDLWVDFRLEPHPHEQTISFGTFGLERFSLPELEVPHCDRPPRWVLDWLFNLSHSVLENGVELEHEQTFGMSEEEKFYVTREPASPEMGRSGGNVLRVHFEEPG